MVTPEEAAARLKMPLRFLEVFIRSGAMVTAKDGTISEEEFEDFSERRDRAKKDLAEAFERGRTPEFQERVIEEIVQEMEAMDHRHKGDPRPDWGW